MRKKYLFLATFFCVALFTFLCKPNLAFADYEIVVKNNTYIISSSGNFRLTASSDENLNIPTKIYSFNNVENSETIYSEEATEPEGYYLANVYNVTQICLNSSWTGETVNIPDSITAILNPYNLYAKKFIVDSSNNNFSSDDSGVLFNKDKNKLIRFPVATTSREYTIPDTVSTIDFGAFGMGENSAVFIPTVDISITFPAQKIEFIGVPFRYGKYSTIDAKFLKSDSFKSIFFYSTFDTLIYPEAITNVDFTKPNTINTIKFSKNIINFSDETILGLGNIVNITDYDGNAFINDYFLFENGVLFNNGKTKLIRLCKNNNQNYIIPNTITDIGLGAFSDSSLSSITIPKTICVIPYGAFMNCKNLTEITIPESVVAFDYGAFNDCTNLKKLKVLGDIKLWGVACFYNCPLDTISIPCDYDKNKISPNSGIAVDITPNSNNFYVSVSVDGKETTYQGMFNYLHSSAYDPDNGVICSKCGVDITSTEPHTHDMTEANCTHFSYCKICGHVDMNNLEKNPNVHKWEIDPITGYPTCTLCGTGPTVGNNTKKVTIKQTTSGVSIVNDILKDYGFTCIQEGPTPSREKTAIYVCEDFKSNELILKVKPSSGQSIKNHTVTENGDNLTYEEDETDSNVYIYTANVENANTYIEISCPYELRASAKTFAPSYSAIYVYNRALA